MRANPPVLNARTLVALLACIAAACADEGPPTAPPPESGPLTLEADGRLRYGHAFRFVDTLEVRITRDGTPAPGVTVDWSASHGSLRALDAGSDADGVTRALWSLDARTDTQIVTASLDTLEARFIGLVPAVDVELLPRTTTLWVGDTTRVAVVFRDARGTVLDGSAAWLSADSAVALVDADGLVRATGVGQTTIGARGYSPRMALHVFPVGTTTTIHGRIATLDPEAELPAFEVRYEDAIGRGTSTGAGDGSWVLTLRHLPLGGDTAVIIIDPVGEARHAWHPALHTVHEPDLGDEVRTLLMPTEWRVRRGVYAGTLVEIDLSKALHPYGVSGASFLGAHAGVGLIAMRQAIWPDSAFPLAVMLAPRPDEPAFTPPDSIGLWTRLNRMEELTGIDLFEPATVPPGSPYPPELPNSIYVSRPISTPIGGASSSRWRTHELPLPRQPEPILVVLGAAEYETGVVFLNFFPGGPAPIDHEFGHAIGMGHACLWLSIMRNCPPYTVTPTIPLELIAIDIAYFELGRAAFARDAELGLIASIVNASMGHRVARLGLTPIPYE